MLLGRPNLLCRALEDHESLPTVLNTAQIFDGFSCLASMVTDHVTCESVLAAVLDHSLLRLASVCTCHNTRYLSTAFLHYSCCSTHRSNPRARATTSEWDGIGPITVPTSCPFAFHCSRVKLPGSVPHQSGGGLGTGGPSATQYPVQSGSPPGIPA